LLLVSSKLANERVIIEDSSHEGTSRIRAVLDKRKLVSAEPTTTILFLGNG
jgi:hypothetical protein